jgi:hypothetical protein
MTDTMQQRDRLLVADSATRKTYPMFSGLLAYFPDALAYVAWVSHQGNEKHNPGEPLHHARGKSRDHADCIVRHVARHGQFDGDVRESGALAWRALALLQEELEQAHGLPLPRGARGERSKTMAAWSSARDASGAQEHWGPVSEGPSGAVIPANGQIVEVKQQPGESMSEAICRTTREAHKFDRLRATPAPESRHGFTVGEMVETVTGRRGPVVGFGDEFIYVNTPNYPRGGWFPQNLKRVPKRTEPLT